MSVVLQWAMKRNANELARQITFNKDEYLNVQRAPFPLLLRTITIIRAKPANYGSWDGPAFSKVSVAELALFLGEWLRAGHAPSDASLADAPFQFRHAFA